MLRFNDPTDTRAALWVSAGILVFEAVMCPLIITRIPYTELDWVAYMEEVEGFLKGQLDYRELRGQTGPLVYPAGFVYIFSFLRWLTGGGDIRTAQYVFAVLYIATQAVVLWLYIKAKVIPPWALTLLALSKRLHSIFMLRLFNDCVAMLLAYVATGLLLLQRWRASLVVYSAAVSVKMNVLLMAPPVLLVLLKAAEVQEIVEGAMQGVALQMFLGAPFLLHNAGAYVSRAFELSRVFQHVWSVNLKFLPEPVFQSRSVASALLAAHLALLLLFAHFRWCRKEGGLWAVIQSAMQRLVLSVRLREQKAGWRSRAGPRGPAAQLQLPRLPQLPASHILLLVFSGNFIGIVCARTLHYQFYSWYFHTIPLLLWSTRLPTAVRLSLWLCIEVIFNIYPSTPQSSMALMGCHLIILSALAFLPVRSDESIAKQRAA
ncbi:Dol-P-Man:Man(5)GlcNAc(2)-PP-Dol alpha-1,3-mannosyltransferase [Coccomyxa sp. Obi]|nr:Dol-P-Man:Man(5)GlcNAc(2)-PP-Dol alpha-1,3-mannosyltransferase [Coccomyxa sp. Obi]